MPTAAAAAAPRRQVPAEEGEARARAKGLLFIETSARDGSNVKALFRRLATALPGDAGRVSAAAGGGGGGRRDVVQLRLETRAGEAPAAGGCAC